MFDFRYHKAILYLKHSQFNSITVLSSSNLCQESWDVFLYNFTIIEIKFRYSLSYIFFTAKTRGIIPKRLCINAWCVFSFLHHSWCFWRRTMRIYQWAPWPLSLLPSPRLLHANQRDGCAALLDYYKCCLWSCYDNCEGHGKEFIMGRFPLRQNALWYCKWPLIMKEDPLVSCNKSE